MVLIHYFNPEFGEVDIESPFDTIFEVRAAHINFAGGGGNSGPFGHVLSKKIIGGAEKYINANCFGGDRVYILVNAKYQPVTFYWDREYFFNYSFCQQSAYMTPDESSIVNGFWMEMEGRRGACLTSESQLEITLTSSSPAMYEMPALLPPVHTGNADTIYGVILCFSSSYSESYCSLPSAVSTPGSAKNLMPFPNPSADIIHIPNEGSPVEQLRIVNCTGSVVQAHSGVFQESTIDIDIAHLPQGIYFIKTNHADKSVGTGCFVKM